MPRAPYEVCSASIHKSTLMTPHAKATILSLSACLLITLSSFAQQPINPELTLLEAQIAATNGHYKTVSEAVLDKEMVLKTTKNRVDAKEVEATLIILRKDKSETEAKIEQLAEKYNALLRKKKK
jgi:hypothetical protein